MKQHPTTDLPESQPAMSPVVDTMETPEAGTSPKTAPKRRSAKQRRRLRNGIVAGVLVVLVAGAAVFVLPNLTGARNATGPVYVTHTVARGNVTRTLEGSGPLQPADAYTITSLIEGEILETGFAEGDRIQKDEVLYVIDSTDVASSIEQAELSLAESRRQYETRLSDRDKLVLRAPDSGTVTEMRVEPGDAVTAGQTIAVVREEGFLQVVVPFSADVANTLRIGQAATVQLTDAEEQFTGTVTKIGGETTVQTGNFATRPVTVEIPNPGALTSARKARVVIGMEEGLEAGSFTAREAKPVVAETSGDVAEILVPEGMTAKREQPLVRLSSDTLEDAILSASDNVRNAEIALEKQTDKRDSYRIASPINGTVVEKVGKTGDTLSAGKPLCTIYDLTWLELTLQVDELDIASVEVGQRVTLTAAAVPGQTYEGTVTRRNINGTTTGTVTTYPVTIRIDLTDGLLPGMNVDAEIVVEEAQNALVVPAEALRRGDVLLVRDAASTTTGGASSGTNPSGNTSGGDPSENATSGGTGAGTTIPAGYHEQVVKTGISDGEFLVIEEGVAEGDVITYLPVQIAGTSLQDRLTNGDRGFPAPPAGGGGNFGGGAGTP